MAVKKIKEMSQLLFQRLWITFELFQKNGLTNHAAAGAYSFLLSAAPVLLIIFFFISRLLINSPEYTADIFMRIGFLSGILDENDLVRDFLSFANSGWVGLISIVPLFWTARLCVLSMQRGLGIIFPSSRFNPLRSMSITFGLVLLIILFIFIILLGYIFSTALSPNIRLISIRFFSIGCLTLIVLISYRFLPMDAQKWKYIISGVFICIVLNQLFAAGFSFLVGPDRYNLLYGALGRLFLLLVNVYFFFMFFLFGAQFMMVQRFSDALLFTRFRKLKAKSLISGISPTLPWEKLFALLPGSLEKYLGFYKKGDVIFYRGSQSHEVYFILSGNVGVYLDDKCLNRIALINETHFFGEMELTESEGRSASIKAETDLSVIVLSRDLFRTILRIDPETDQKLILDLSERLRSTNKQVVS